MAFDGHNTEGISGVIASELYINRHNKRRYMFEWCGPRIPVPLQLVPTLCMCGGGVLAGVGREGGGKVIFHFAQKKSGPRRKLSWDSVIGRNVARKGFSGGCNEFGRVVNATLKK